MAYPSNRWTPDEEALLRKLLFENASPFEIAVELGRSISSVKARAHRLGIPLGFLLRQSG
jgi:DNA-directed RNA polymerase specialized sigma24 family protein